MSATEEVAAEDKPGHSARRDEPEGDSVSKVAWHKRLRQGIAAKLGRMVAGLIAKLERLKGRLGGGDEESEERPRARPAPPPPPKEEAAPAVHTELGPKKSHKLRNVLLVVLLALASAGLGAGAAHTMLSRLLKDQSLAIESHEQELRGFQLQEQESAKKMAELLRKLEAEQKLRADMEARLVEAERQRQAAEATAKQPVSQVQKPELAVKKELQAVPQVKKEPDIAVSPAGRPSKASSFRPPTVNCNLAGSDPAALKRCLDDYNRK